MRTSSECNISLKFQNRLINEWIFDYYCKIANNTVQYIADAFLILFFFFIVSARRRSDAFVDSRVLRWITASFWISAG